MTWAHFYLLCFAVGFAFSMLSFLLGGLHWHLPFHFHFGDGPLIHTGHHVPVGHGAGNGQSGHHHDGVSVLNPPTVAAFLAWFGGCGYLLTRYSSLVFLVGLGLATLSGLVGASIVFLFLSKVLMSEKGYLDPSDYEMVGVLGRTSIPIREGGTGEIIYSQAGIRCTCGARTEDGRAIAKGCEVVITRYEKGIAYVRLWSEMAGDDHAPEKESL